MDNFIWQSKSRDSRRLRDHRAASRLLRNARRKKLLAFEGLERRALLAADYLYSLNARPGSPDDGFGFATAANDEFHVVSNVANVYSPYFLENYPEYHQSRFFGEIQVHDASDGSLLRTIQNPLPFGHPDFCNCFGFDNAFVNPNLFGYSIDIHDNLLLVGSPGWEGEFMHVASIEADRDTGGRAFLFDANNGNLLHTFDGSFYPEGTGGRNNDGFGRSVAIDGDRIIIGAHGPSYQDPESQRWDTDPGRVYIYSTATGDLLDILSPGNPNGSSTIDFGATVDLSNGKVVVTQGDELLFENLGPTLVYSATTGNLLHNLLVNGMPAMIEGSDIAIRVAEDTVIANAVTGDITQTIPVGLLDFDGNLIVASSPDAANALPVVHDFPSGDFLYAIPAAPGMLESDIVSSKVQVFGDRLLLPSQRSAPAENVVFVYSITPGPDNAPPTDIGLTNNVIPENAANNSVVGILSAVDNDTPETFDFVLTNSAGGRFKIVGNQLLVNNGALLDFETNPIHHVIVQVIDSAGNLYAEALTIHLSDISDITDTILSANTVAEPKVRWIHNLTSSSQLGRSFGQSITVDSNKILVGELDMNSPQLQFSRVLVLDAETGNQLTVLMAPNPVVNQVSVDGLFGYNVALSGDLAVISAEASDVGTSSLAGAVFVFNATTGDLLHTLSSPTPGNSLAFGRSLAVLGDRIAIGSLDGPQGEGVVYIFNAVTGDLLTTIANPDPDAVPDLFGDALAFSGDTLVVGTPEEKLIGQAIGRAYIYHIHPVTSAATLAATIDNPITTGTTSFARSLATDGTLVAISATGEDSGGLNSGAVYIYDAATGNFLRKLVEASASPANLLGQSIWLRGDYVFATSRSTNSNSGGVIRVFHAITGENVATITNPTPDDTDSFGRATAMHGNRIVISDPGDDTDELNRGMVYSFDFPIGQTIGVLSSTDSDSSETFTYTLLDDADGRFAVDGNQLTVADATKLNYESSTSHSITVKTTASGGSQLVRVFTVNVTPVNEPPLNTQLTGNVNQGRIRHLHHPAVAKGFGIGYQTAADGDLIVIGTNNLSSNAGEVYVMNAISGDLVTAVASPSPQVNELFGEQVAISGNRLVVSSRLRDIEGNSNVGQVYVFNAITGLLLSTLNTPQPSVNGQFGAKVAIDGDLIVVADTTKVFLYSANSGNLLHAATGLGAIVSVAIDGSLIVVGRSNGPSLVYEFNVNAQTLSLVHSLASPIANGGLFGFKVAITGNHIAISAPFDDELAVDNGKVYLFDRSTGNLLHTLNNPTPAADDQFGISIALNEKWIAVAAQNDDSQAMDAGQVYLFDVITGQRLKTIRNPTPDAGDLFSRVSFAESRVVIGAPLDDTDGINLGMVYVYDTTSNGVSSNLTTLDPDFSDAITHTLLDDSLGRFAILGSTIVATNSLLLDSDLLPFLDVVVQSTDAGGLSITERISVATSKGPQPPTNITMVGNSVVERASNSTLVATLSTSDPNATDTFTYSLVNSAGGRFGIVGNTIVVANGVAIDFETSPAHSVIVKVTDSSGLSTIESFRILVVDAPETFDFGDLPVSFGTTMGGNGARHEVFNGGPRLGSSITIDNDGQPNATATLDAFDDGVVLPALLIPNLNAVFTVTASQAGKLDAFIDFGGNGNFSESERITPVGGVQLVAGLNTFMATIPATAASGNRGARFRFSTGGGLGPTGVAADGEVEDYRIDVLAPANLSSQLLPDPENPGQTLMFVRGSALNDVIAVDPVGPGLRATINGVQGATLAAPNRIIMYGVSGNDDLRINTMTIPGIIDGGLGDDIIRGGNGPDQLYGRAGNDVIFGRGGVDLIYGSSGNDQLFSDSGAGILFGEGNDDVLVGTGILVGGDGIDSLTATGSRNLLIGGNNGDSLTGADADQGDILVAGYTSYDSNVSALYALREEWRSIAPVLERISHLNGAVAGGLNGVYRLDESTVYLENQVDTMTNFGTTSPQRDDWVFLSAGDIKVNSPGIVVFIDGVMNGASEGTMPDILGLYTNYTTAADVNFDDLVTPLDALMLIDEIIDRRSGRTVRHAIEDSLYFDVNDDLQVSPVDVLFVIEHLMKRQSHSLSGEGESALPAFEQDLALSEVLADWDNIESNFKKRNRYT